MRTFLVIWFGQVVSRLGSGLTGFALAVWVYQRTGSVTQLALISFSLTLPAVLISPFAGTLVDRWDRRWALILSDSGSGLCTLAIALLVWSGRSEIWLIYLALAVSSVFQSVQWPAFSASTSLLVRKQDLGRANGLAQLGLAIAQVLAPVLGAALLATIHLAGVILVDFLTFAFAILTLALVRVPRPVRAEAARGSLWHEAGQGWRYLRQRPGLLGLLTLFATTNFSVGMVTVLITPLVLSFATPAVLGPVLSVAGAGMLVGGVAMSAWGGPRRRVVGIFVPLLVQVAALLAGSLRPSAPLIAGAAFVFMLGFPIINACSQAIWQTKVAPDVQGRVFAIRQMVALSAIPLAQLLAGPLSDRVFRPLLVAGGPLAGSVGRVLGVGPARGIALLFMALAMVNLLVLARTWSNPQVRRVDEEIPDADLSAVVPRPEIQPQAPPA
jgi:MFS transporter, DHA3 family, macrolide efflux protein